MSKKLFGYSVDSQWDYENGFYLTSHVTRIAKAVAHYELYKSILGLPGHIVECGVYKGASLIRFATFREMTEHPSSRKIIGFDMFGKFPGQTRPDDVKFVKDFERAGGDGISVDDLKDVLDHKGFRNIELVPGDVLQTLPRHIEDHPELKVSLLHLDLDVYEPTVAALACLYDRVVKGGLIILDDYGTVPGATAAVDEFFADRKVLIEKLPISHIPAFIRKA